MCARMCVYCARIFPLMSIRKCVYICMCVCVCKYTDYSVWIRAYICMCIFMCARMGVFCACIFALICAYAYVYVYTLHLSTPFFCFFPRSHFFSFDLVFSFLSPFLPSSPLLSFYSISCPNYGWQNLAYRNKKSSHHLHKLLRATDKGVNRGGTGTKNGRELICVKILSGRSAWCIWTKRKCCQLWREIETKKHVNY